MNLDFWYLMLIFVVQINDEMLIVLDLVVHSEDVFVEVVDQLNEILIEFLQNEFSIEINIELEIVYKDKKCLLIFDFHQQVEYVGSQDHVFLV